jgi:hypothetical protein
LIFLLHFLDKYNIKHNFLFLWERGSGLWRVHLQYMTSIMPTHMSHPISCTDSELAADNLTKIHLDSPNLTNWSTKPQYGQSLPWPIGAQNPYGQSLTWPKALNPYGQSYSLTWTWGVNPHGQSLDLGILCVTYIESMRLKLTFYGDFIPNHNSLFQSFNKNLQAKNIFYAPIISIITMFVTFALECASLYF